MKKDPANNLFQKPVLCSLFFLLALNLPAQQAQYPLDPLTATEISTAVKVLRESPHFPKVVLFSTVVLNEPPKEEVLNYKAGMPVHREAFAVVFDRVNNKTYESIIDLGIKKIISWKLVPDAQPLVFLSEYDQLGPIIKADPRWQAAMRKRGINDFDNVQIDGWAVGQVDEKYTGRLLRGLSYYKGKQVNFYGRPIEGVVALVNMNTLKVLDVTDNDVLPIPPPSKEFDQKSIGKLREKPKPLVITQPKGVSFQMNGQEIRWQKWRFRYTMHPRECLVLYNVGYEESGKDVVAWYTLGITHIPRPEEWPIMPVTHLGFKLIPAGFFTHNPALDVPK